MRNDRTCLGSDSPVAGVELNDRHTGTPTHPEVHGVILAGVHAWGNCALEEVVTRPLLPIGAQPLIWHILRWIRAGGVDKATVCGNSDTAVLHRSLGYGEALDVCLEYTEDIMPRGPAGCAHDAAAGSRAETFVVVDGTVFLSLDLEALLADHIQNEAAVTIAVTESGQTRGRSVEEQEPVGCYVFSRAVLEQVPPTGYQDIKEALIPSLHARGDRVITHVVRADAARRVSNAASYLMVNMWLLEHLELLDAVPNGHVSQGDAWVHPSARIDPSVKFVGPVLVGPETAIESGAVIIGPTTIGQGCSIESSAVISRSAVWDKCRIGPGAKIDYCIIAGETAVEAQRDVRETVYIVQRPSRRRMVDRVASYWRAGRQEHQIAGGG